ncbi:hypothetical protein FALB51S_04112 [Frigidibacter albus]
MFDPPDNLRPMVEWKPEITLVPYSGIQILDFGFCLDDLEIKRRFLERTVHAEADRIEVKLEALPADQAAAARVEALRRDGDPEPYSIDQSKALAPFLGAWVPVPMLRVKRERGAIRGQQFDAGPTSWARMRVVALDHPDPRTGQTHRVQLALDTMLLPDNAEDRYVAPGLADASNPREFCFVAEPEEMGWFLSNPMTDPDDSAKKRDMQRWVSDWIEELFLAFKAVENPDRVFRKEKLKYTCEHWARYIQYLAVIDAAVHIPRVRFLDTVSPRDAVVPVEVDLILDVGNSRTCGILVERFPDEAQVDLTRSYPLELRDLSRPEFHYSGLIESRVEFAELSFGKDRFSLSSGRGNGFLWPSFVRIGPEARRLTQTETGTETTSGLSSPKRYLWDSLPVKQDWRFHNHTDPNTLPRNARAVMQYLNEAGDDLSVVEREIQQGFRDRSSTSLTQAIRPRFSRSAVYTFMLTEIISHALVQINDPGGRSRRKQTDLPRRLSRIILTLPTATPVQEQKIIRSRATAALSLVWKRLGISDFASNISIKPDLIADWDEASCTQLVYLYSEIAQRMDGQIDTFLKLKGAPRPHPDTGSKVPSLRLACIDVGGGTTDLMITTYFGERNAVLEPVQTFREGFRIAGDDLVRKVIADAVLVQLASSAEAEGGRNVINKIAELFAGDIGGRDQQLVQKRRQFVLRVLRPIAVALISACETADPTELVSVNLRELLGLTPPPPPKLPEEDVDPEVPASAIPEEILSYLEAPMRALGADGWTLTDVVVSVERSQIDMIVRDVFGTAIGNMTEVIDHLGADIVLLTGRPSRLPVIRALVEEAMVLPPDRVISMHRYRSGGWYPYRDPVTHRVGDPKSTVAVGGMLMALAGNRIPNFKVKTELCRMRSTARYIGIMDSSGRIRSENVLFSPPDPRIKRKAETRKGVDLDNPKQIGFRQLPLERWTTTALYRLDFASDEARRLKAPLKVILERAEIDDDDENPTLEKLVHLEALLEELVPAEVFDADKEEQRTSTVSFRLHTLGLEQDYWLDTGIVGK